MEVRLNISRTAAALIALLLAPAAGAATLVPCPYAPSELAAAFGKAFRGGKGHEEKIAGGTQTVCTYAQDRSSLTLTVVQTVLPAAEHKRRKAEFEQGLKGKLTPLALDPDDAKWQMDPYAPNFLALHYLHGTKRVELRLTGGLIRPDQMQPKLLRLRRLG